MKIQKEKIILGIDPGTTIMGFGLIKVVGNKMSLLLLNELILNKLDDHVQIVCGLAEDLLDWDADLLIANIHYDVMKDLVRTKGFLQQKWLHYVLAYGGIVFDLLIVPLLLCRRTRAWAFSIAILFHLFNSVVFQIGIFPYMSIALCVFFFPVKSIQKLFFKGKPFYNQGEIVVPNYKPILLMVFGLYFLIRFIKIKERN